jgi:hypothetical protein
MSLSSEFEGLKQSVGPAMRPIVKGTLLFFSGDILETMSDIYFKRNVLPEPFDLPDHIGNFREASMGTVAACAMIGILTCAVPLIDRSRELFKRNAKRAAVGAFAVSSAVQVIGEEFAVTNSLSERNFGDPVDAAYGIAWSAVTAVAAYRMVTGLEQNHHEQKLQETDSADCATATSSEDI